MSLTRDPWAMGGRTVYTLESFVPLGSSVKWLGEHLVALMEARGYEVVGPVVYTRVLPELIPDPPGMVRASVQVAVLEWGTDV